MRSAPSSPALTGSRAPAPTFDAFARGDDDAMDVAMGAALIAKDVYDDLDVLDLLGRLDDLAAPLEGAVLAGLPLAKQVEQISAHFSALGFRGNVDDYYDAKNSLLSDVIERRTGIPITLTVVWCHLARRAGVVARGVGFPGHFLARVDDADDPARDPVLVDPFNAGRVLDAEGARALLQAATGQGAVITPALFAATGARALLVRMLANLKAIWENQGEHARALLAIERMLTLVPDASTMLRERAGIALRLGLHDLAHADLTRVLQLEPAATDAVQIKRHIAALATAARPAAN